jgi:hypothetical protein
MSERCGRLVVIFEGMGEGCSGQGGVEQEVGK